MGYGIGPPSPPPTTRILNRPLGVNPQGIDLCQSVENERFIEDCLLKTDPYSTSRANTVTLQGASVIWSRMPVTRCSSMATFGAWSGSL